MKTTSAVEKSKPTEVWATFRNEFDKLLDRFADGFGTFPLFQPSLGAVISRFFSSVGVLAPCVDISEDDKAYTITAELPGLVEKDVDVSLDGSVLTIKGHKEQEAEKKDKNYYLSERSYGAFERSMYLPEGVDRDYIGAKLANGVLTVTLPKTALAQTKAKKIEVKSK